MKVVLDKLTSYDYDPPGWITKKLRKNGVWDWKSFKISSHAIELPNFVPIPGNQESAEVEVFPDVKITDDVIIEESVEEPAPPVIFIPSYHEEAVFEHIPFGGIDYGGVIAIGFCAFALALCGGGNLGLCFTQEYSVRSFL